MKKVFMLLCLVLVVLSFGCKDSDLEKKKAFEDDYKYYMDEAVVDALGWDWFDKASYNKVFDEHVFVKSTFEEVKSAMEGKERVVIYFGYNPKLYQCPYCATALPIANEAALENGVSKILYLDIFQIRKDETDEYKWLRSFIQEQIPDFGEKILVPDFYVIENGKILSHHIATFKDEEGKYIKDLTDIQKEELKNVYNEMFKE